MCFILFSLYVCLIRNLILSTSQKHVHTTEVVFLFPANDLIFQTSTPRSFNVFALATFFSLLRDLNTFSRVDRICPKLRYSLIILLFMHSMRNITSHFFVAVLRFISTVYWTKQTDSLLKYAIYLSGELTITLMKSKLSLITKQFYI